MTSIYEGKVSRSRYESLSVILESIEYILVELLIILISGGYFGWRLRGTGGCPVNPSMGQI
jgi:hypothetical protein